MALVVSCPDCDKKLKLKEEFAGKKVRCPDCSTVITIPMKSKYDDDLDDYSDDDSPPPRKRRPVEDDDDDADAAPRSVRSGKKKKKKSGRSKSSGTNWVLIGGLAGGGLVLALFVAMLVASINHARNGAPNRAAAQAPWPTFRHPAGTAQIDMPATPAFNQQQSVGGAQTYVLVQRNYQMSLISATLPADAWANIRANPAVVDFMFSEMETKTPQQTPGSRMLSSRRFTAGNYRALELKLDIKGNINLMRFYLVPNALIGAEFITRNETAYSAERERFFHSFRGPDGNLLENPNAAPAGAHAQAQIPNTAHASTGAAPVSNVPYLDRLAKFKTKLTRQGPAPQDYSQDKPPKAVEEITFQSGNLTLKAWFALPKIASSGSKVPAVIYFHGGFAFGADDFKDASPFLKAGYAVMCPMLRGENGNPGNFELYAGEVDDAKAAVAWLAAHEKVDATHLYTFGHSAGGVISALLSLHDVPVRLTGSSGGLYGPRLFDLMTQEAPFSIQDMNERQMRVLVGNVQWMKRKHIAYVGGEDMLQEVDAAKKESKNPNAPLEIVKLQGDHHTSLKVAISAFRVKLIADR